MQTQLSPPPAMQVNASNYEAGGNCSRTSDGAESYFISCAQLGVNSWIVGFAGLFKLLAELKGDTLEQISAANYTRPTLSESAMHYKYNFAGIRNESSLHLR